MERCLAAGFLHEDMEFQNVDFDPETLGARFIDIEYWDESDLTDARVLGHLRQ